MAEQFLTVEQAASRLQIHPITVRRHLQKGILRGIKQGRLWRITESALVVPAVTPSPQLEPAASSPLLRALAMVEERDARVGSISARRPGVNDAVTHIKEVREARTPRVHMFASTQAWRWHLSFRTNHFTKKPKI